MPIPILLTGYTQHVAEIGDYCLESKRQWANRHGMGFFNLRDKDFPREGGHPSFQKLYWIRFYLERHNRPVFWLDADSYVTSPEHDPSNLVSIIPPSCSVAASVDYSDGGRPQRLAWSAGNTIWTPTAAAKEWLTRAMADESSRWGGLWDQDALQKTQRDDDLFLLPARALNAVSPSFVLPASWKPGDLLCHFTGIDQSERLEVAKQFVKENFRHLPSTEYR